MVNWDGYYRNGSRSAPPKRRIPWRFLAGVAVALFVLYQVARHAL